MAAWGQSGMKLAHISAHIIALHMIVTNDKKEIGLILIIAYAPMCSQLEEDWTSFFDNDNKALQLCKRDDISITSMDTNSSMGVKDGNVLQKWNMSPTAWSAATCPCGEQPCGRICTVRFLRFLK
eukprot:1548025-Ditylum_brightwellii.AAC.1